MDWISVEDELPEPKQVVWCYDSSAVFETGRQRSIIYYQTDEIWEDGTITHWMPLPERPHK